MNSFENPQLSYECDLTAERDRLREINKKLLAALKWVWQEIEWGHDMTASAAIIQQTLNRAKGEA